MFTVYVVVCMLYYTGITVQGITCRNFPYNGEFETITHCKRSQRYVMNLRVRVWRDSALLEWAERGKGYTLRTPQGMSFCWKTNRRMVGTKPTAKP